MSNNINCVKVRINRTGDVAEIEADRMVHVGDILNSHGFFHVDPSTICNFDDIEWAGCEFNRLYIRNDELYRFNFWIGEYPDKAIQVEKIGNVIVM